MTRTIVGFRCLITLAAALLAACAAPTPTIRSQTANTSFRRTGPATAFAISAQSGNIYAGLWYAIVIAVMTVIVGTIFVPGGTHKKDIFADDMRR